MTRSIQQLVDSIKGEIAHGDSTDIASAVVAFAEPYAADQNWVTDVCFETDPVQGFGVTVLHEEPDHSLIVETVSWEAGKGVAPHDHQTWGVVVGLVGAETNVNWRRLDDGSKPGFADLEIAEEISIGCGDSVTFRPDDIHSVRNDGGETSLSLHIYGKSLAHVDRSEFDPINKIQRPCPKRARNEG